MQELIYAVAVKCPRTGRVFEADTHFDCWCQMIPEFNGNDMFEMLERTYGLGEDVFQCEGFTTTLGRFVSREEALLIAKDADQTDSMYTCLCGEDLRFLGEVTTSST